MGLDAIGWRNCDAQEELGPDGFFAAVVARAHAPGAVTSEGGRAFERHAAACDGCPLSGGRPFGCHRTVAYPIDEGAERALFEVFAKGAPVPGSASDALHRTLVTHVPEGTPWAALREGERRLAVLPAPLEHEWEEGESRRRVDSARLLAALLLPIDDVEQLRCVARFFAEVRALTPPSAGAGGSLRELLALGELFEAVSPRAEDEGWGILIDA